MGPEAQGTRNSLRERHSGLQTSRCAQEQNHQRQPCGHSSRPGVLFSGRAPAGLCRHMFLVFPFWKLLGGITSVTPPPPPAPRSTSFSTGDSAPVPSSPSPRGHRDARNNQLSSMLWLKMTGLPHCAANTARLWRNGNSAER